MAILEKEVWVGISGKNANYYESLGYEISRYIDKQGRQSIKRGTKILVKIEDLVNPSVKVTKICDKCGIHITNQLYSAIVNGRSNSKDGMDRCHNCSVSNNGKRNSIPREDECIANMDEEFAKLLWNKEDSYKYSCRSGMIVHFRCPDCGNKIRNKRIADIYFRGLMCPKCSDGISYPEKFIYNVLDQSNINFTHQKTFNWSNNKRYDFYLPLLNCIIEVHGHQHYGYSNFDNFGGRTLQEEQKNDELKELLAIQNGIDKYIVIDARHSTIEHIKNSIVKSELKTIISTEVVDWKKCDKYATSSLVNLICDIWNSGIIDLLEISSLTKLHLSTVYKYLNKGSKMGLCNYDGENKKCVIQLSLDMKFIRKFESISEAKKTTGIDGSAISKVCRNKLKKTGGYKWMYEDTYVEYIQNLE